jgi:hypothetical protein
MQPHPYFDLLLHSDAELSTLLQEELSERLTLHEWPLSCVQRLSCASGRRVIYKACRQPTLEAEFYAAARSPLLISCQVLYRQGAYTCLLLEHLKLPHLSDQGWSERQALIVVRGLLAQIAAIQGDLPYGLDITRRALWQAYVDRILAGLRQLIAEGKFVNVRLETVALLERWASNEPVLAAVEDHPGYVHSDLTAENIFPQPGGWKVIDWQRPLRGPVALDLANLLESLGFDPRKSVPAEIISILYFLRLGWFCECALEWFPPGVDAYDRQIAGLIKQII